MSATLFLTLMLAQSPAVEAGDPAQLERIRRALAEAPALAVEPVPRADGPVFRVTVRERLSDKPMWSDWSPIPTNIRPWFRGYHHEFLEQVTPEAFRSATLYPTGLPVLPLIELLARRIKAANRKIREGNAKDEVRQALEELLACRADPAKPGC